MKHKIILLSFLIFVILVIISFEIAMPTTQANGFLDWLTGKATKPTNVTITVSQLAIPWVSAIESPQNVTESSKTTVVFYFNATIPGGLAANINKSSAIGNFSKTSETTRQNTSCINVSEGTDWVNFSCSIDVWYWDGAGYWNVTAYIKDSTGNAAVNTSSLMNLSESTCLVVSPNELTWATLVPGATDQASSNDPTLINNTCNNDIASGGIELNATDLVGESNNEFQIAATSFMTHINTGGDECSAGTSLVNWTYQSITSSELSAGNNSLSYGNATSGQEQLYYCIPLVDAGLMAQTYSTDIWGAWSIQIS